MKICLIGSTRYMDQFHDANRRLTLLGHVVYSVAMPSSQENSVELTPDQKLILDAVHLQKIEESDTVVLVGEQLDGSMYIGESTRRELAFAEVSGKQVVFWRPDSIRDLDGPTMSLEGTLHSAIITRAERDARRARMEEDRRRMMEQLAGQVIGDGHTGLPDCPECAKDDAEAGASETTANPIN